MNRHRSAAAARSLAGAALVGTSLIAGIPARTMAQWSTTYEQHYLPGKFNWAFRNNYPAADRLFNAFDYGHAILYERLYTKPGADPSLLEVREYDFITKKLLVSPPRLPLEEAAIEVEYAKMAPEAKMMFDWAHLLHRQIYDVLAMESMSQADKDAKVEELVRYYKTRPDLAFSSVPKNMDLMEEQPYSLAFRQRYPKFNGLIWGYHWLQVGLYEPLVVGRTLEERQSGISGAVTRFKQMLENAPEHMPRVMPMTAAIAPEFSKRYPEPAIIFDNLHSMHDVVSDILANANVPRDQKRAEILKAASRYRDSTSFVMTRAEWLQMSTMMGSENMGGPAIGFLAGWPTPTIERGMTMARAMQSMDHANMPGMKTAADSTRGSSASAHAGHDMSATKADSAKPTPATQDHAAMGHAVDSTAMVDAMMTAFMQLAGDSIVRRRIASDTAMRGSLERMIEQMPAEHREHMRMMLPATTQPSIAVEVAKEPGVPTSARSASTVTKKATPSTTRSPTRPASTKSAPRPASTKTAPRPATTKTAPRAAVTKKADSVDHSKHVMPPKPPAKKPPAD